MVEVLTITAPIYLIIAAGWMSVRLDVFDKQDMRLFGRFVLQIALPALLFGALSSRRFADILQPIYLAAYVAGSICAFGAGWLWARYGAGRSLSSSAIMALGMACSNSGFIGFPLVHELLGPPAAIGLALGMLVENIVVVPLALVLAEFGQRSQGLDSSGFAALRRVFLGLSRNPMILAIVLGLCVSALQLHLPEPATRAVQILGTSCGALALFVIGGTLHGLHVRGQVRDVAVITVGKLVLHPLAVAMFLLLLPPLAPELRWAPVLFAAAPMLSIFPIIAQRHGIEELSALSLLTATLASFVTLTALVWWVRHGVAG